MNHGANDAWQAISAANKRGVIGDVAQFSSACSCVCIAQKSPRSRTLECFSTKLCDPPSTDWRSHWTVKNFNTRLYIMKYAITIILIAFGLSSCKSPEELPWKSDTIYDARKMKKLLDEGVNPNLEAGGTFLLKEATDSQRLDTLKILLERGADPDKKTAEFGKTCLFLAAYSGNVEIAQALLNAKADINAVDNNGNNALREVIGNRRTRMVEFLLKNGANPLHRNAEGDTMYDLAVKLKNPKIMAILDSHMEEGE